MHPVFVRWIKLGDQIRKKTSAKARADTTKPAFFRYNGKFKLENLLYMGIFDGNSGNYVI